MINPFKKSYSSQDINLFRFLARIKLFERLNYEEMAQFTPHMYLRPYKLEEVVFFRNDPSNALYIIKNGRISMKIDVNNEFQTLATLGSGEAFGDNALLTDTRRIYTSIVSSDNADLYVLPSVNIQEILDGEPKIKAKIMTSFAEVYNQYNANIFKAYRSSFGFFDLAQAYDEG